MRCYRKHERHLIENYEKALADNFKGWVLHHRLELTLDGEFAHTAEELKRMGIYYNRPYFELIYLTRSEHASLHGKVNDLSYLHTEEINKKRALAQTGKPSWNKGKHLSESHKQALSKSHTGKSATWNKHPKSQATKNKLSKFYTGKHWKIGPDGKRVWY